MNEEEKERKIPPELPDFENMTTEELASWDKLGFIDIAGGIVKDIERFQPPLIYGVYGRWGSGKTCLMRAIQDCFKARKGYKTVWFDPWWYDHADKEQLFLGLLRKIEKETNAEEKTFTDIGLRFGAGVRTAFQLLLDVGLSKLGTSLKNAKEFWKESLEVLGNEQINQVDAVEKTREALCRAINGVLKEDETLVLFVDDLDRCLPDRAILLLDQLKNFLHLPRVITVLGIDDKVFARMLNRHYRYQDEKEVLDQESTKGKEESLEDRQDFGRQYLKKIVRKPYRINVKTMIELLKQYEGYSDWFRIHPKLTSVMGQLWGIMKPANARELKRCAEKFLSLIRFKECGDVLNSIAERQNQANEVTWKSFLGTVGPYRTSSQRDLLNVLHNLAMLLILWEVVVLSEGFDFPLNIKKTYREHKKLLSKNSTLPIPILNQVYNEIVTLS